MSGQQSILYHEPQVASLCGCHALNTLLQGPFFSEVDLASIAQDLDARERQLMMESGKESADFLKFLAEDSGNVAADGNFSIQVLSKALELWQLTCLPITNPAAGAAQHEPEKEMAFLCNLREHWFTIRRVDGEWFNFNSLFPAPAPLSQFYLQTFLSSLQQEGYTIFVVRGRLAPHGEPTDVAAGGPGNWMTVAQAAQATKGAEEAKQRGAMLKLAEGAMARASSGQSIQFHPRDPFQPTAGHTGLEVDGDGEAEQIQAAIAASLHDAGLSGGGWGSGLAGGLPSAQHTTPMYDQDVDADMAAAIAASLAEPHAGVAQPPPPPPTSDADELAAGIALSLAGGAPVHDTARGALQPGQMSPHDGASNAVEVPEEPEVGMAGVVDLGIRLPHGERLTRRFLEGTQTRAVAAFVAAKGVDMTVHHFETSFPKTTLTADETTLAEAGIRGRSMLMVVRNNS
ncbi:hypothetical protein CYMTET_19044 [Cymbomonas tetramitiformis]|uniref:ubiquitinyl hydrolase 1 n=1 Tax=Cymbomonas tetramitiformis TaxID=36881 RepID=A0AAE0L5C6_9CHLO|nr:hypothetical protein CYMTET_19044 [Cymbomonas tetramitiformis]